MIDAKLLAGSSGYDVVLHSGAMSSRLIPEGFFLPLDLSKLPNIKHLDPEIMAFLETYDPGNKHSLPYMWGSTGITYNVDMIRERMPDAPLDSGDMIFKPEVVLQICRLRSISTRQSVGCHTSCSRLPWSRRQLCRSGCPATGGGPSQCGAAVYSLFQLDKGLIDIPNGEICVAMEWSGDYATAAARAAEAGIDITLAYIVPKEGPRHGSTCS